MYKFTWPTVFMDIVFSSRFLGLSSFGTQLSSCGADFLLAANLLGSRPSGTAQRRYISHCCWIF